MAMTGLSLRFNIIIGLFINPTYILSGPIFVICISNLLCNAVLFCV